MKNETVLVLGLGNPVMADDGVGLAALARLQADWHCDPAVEFADGGTWGMRLLPLIQDHDRVLFLDAIHHGGAPGSLTRLDGDAIPRALGVGKLSPHQLDLQDILAAAALTESLPAQMTALGVQPRLVEMRVGLTPEVEAGVPALVDAAVARLREWGVRCSPVESLAGA